jgi:hypothetical protein
MTSYAISDTSNSFIHMAYTTGITSESNGQLSVNNTAISPSFVTTENVVVSGQIRCGGLQPDTPSKILYPGLVPLSSIFGTYTVFKYLNPFTTSINPIVYTSLGIAFPNPVVNPDPNEINKYYFKDLSGSVKDSSGKELDPFSKLSLINADNYDNISIYVEMDKVDIAAKNWIHSGLGFIQSSDQRIKTDIKTYNSSVALEQLNALRVVSYKKIETPLQEEVGFIAQEVHKILPNAIEKMKMYIPNIHKWFPCTYDDKKHTISVDNSSLNLAYKENIQIKDDKGMAYSCIVIDTEYSAILHLTEFLTNPPSIKDKVFLYGKSVNDFMSLNKDDIFSIAVSAIQMLDQKVTDLTTRLESLERRFL